MLIKLIRKIGKDFRFFKAFEGIEVQIFCCLCRNAGALAPAEFVQLYVPQMRFEDATCTDIIATRIPEFTLCEKLPQPNEALVECVGSL